MVLGSAVCYRGRRTSASRDVLPAQHNTGQGLGSARVVPAVCEGDILQGSATDNLKDWTNSQDCNEYKAVQGSL